MDLVSDVVGDDGRDPEDPVDRLTRWSNSLNQREIAAFVELVQVVLRLSQR
jgi:hypothetical protein